MGKCAQQTDSKLTIAKNVDPNFVEIAELNLLPHDFIFEKDGDTLRKTWKKMEKWINAGRGTPKKYMEETILEFQFHHNHLTTKKLNFWKMLKVISQTGLQSMEMVDNDMV